VIFTNSGSRPCDVSDYIVKSAILNTSNDDTITGTFQFHADSIVRSISCSAYTYCQQRTNHIAYRLVFVVFHCYKLVCDHFQLSYAPAPPHTHTDGLVALPFHAPRQQATKNGFILLKLYNSLKVTFLLTTRYNDSNVTLCGTTGYALQCCHRILYNRRG